LLNSIVLCKVVQFACIDIKNFYPSTPMEDPKYSLIKITGIPEEFILEYRLARKKITMDVYTSKYKVGAIGYLEQVCLQTTYYVDNWKKKATIKPLQLQACGNKNGDRYNFF
jgi:hypothetical protein